MERIKIYYDGSCQVCTREMRYYRERDKAHALEFIDITGPGFKAEAYDRNQDEFMARLHVQDQQGRFHTGIDAFAVIWQCLPGIHLDLLAGVVQLPGVHLLATVGYEAFARLRTWLPKSTGGCDDESCRWGHPHSHR